MAEIYKTQYKTKTDSLNDFTLQSKFLCVNFTFKSKKSIIF